MSQSLVSSASAPAGRAPVTNLESETIEDIMNDLHDVAYGPQTVIHKEVPAEPPSLAQQSALLDIMIRDMQSTCISSEISDLTTIGPSTSCEDSEKNKEITSVCQPKLEDPFEPFAPFVAGDYILVSPERNDQRLAEGPRYVYVWTTPRDPLDARKVLKDRRVMRTLVPIPKEHVFDMAGFEKTMQKPVPHSLFEIIRRGDSVPLPQSGNVSPGDKSLQSISGFHLVKEPGVSPSWDAVSNQSLETPLQDRAHRDNVRLQGPVDHKDYTDSISPISEEYWYVTPNSEFSHGLSWDTAGSYPPEQPYFSEDDIQFCNPHETVVDDPLKEMAGGLQEFDRGSWEITSPSDNSSDDEDVQPSAAPSTRRKRMATEALATSCSKKPKTGQAAVQAKQPVRKGQPAAVSVASSASRLVGSSARANPDGERTGSLPSKALQVTAKLESDDSSTPFPNPVGPSDRNTFRCYMATCNESFDNLADVPLHFRSVHGTGTQLRCAYRDCERTTNSIGDMGRHELALAHKAPSFICKKCRGAFTREDALKRHARKCYVRAF